MMKLNSVISGLLVLGLVGCGGSSKKSDSGEGSAVDFSESTAPVAKDRVTPAAPIESTPINTSGQSADANLQAAIKSNNFDQIHRAALTVLGERSEDPKALNAMGLVYYRQNRWGAAELMFGKALQASPNSPEILNNLALVQLGKGDRKEAILTFRRALQSNPNYAQAAANIGSIYVEEQDYAKALVALEIAVKRMNKDSKVLNNYAIALTASGRHEQAQDYYERALKVQPGSPEIMLNLASLLIEHLNNKPAGLDYLNKVKFSGPTGEARNRINTLENKAKAGLN